MSYIVRKSIEGGNIDVVGKLCEMRGLEMYDAAAKTWKPASRESINAFLGDRLNPGKSQFALRIKDARFSVAVQLSDNKLSFTYDSDHELMRNPDGLTIFQMFVSDNGQPTTAYLQAATALYAEQHDLSYEVQADYVGQDGVWMVGDVDIVVESSSEQQIVGTSAV